MSEPAASSSSSSKSKKRWFPLESNPAAINSYLSKLGYDTSVCRFVDVFSTEDWALDMVPQPVGAVLLLYPPTARSAPEDDVVAAPDVTREKVWFVKQNIGNACGTIGLLHSLLNLPEGMRVIEAGSWLEAFANDCPIPLDPAEKARRLEDDPVIETLHDEATSSADNATDRGRTADDEVLTHFIALVCAGDRLYELDGRKPGPIDHGPTTRAGLLRDAMAVVRKFMARDPTEVRFTITALAPN